MKAFDFDAVTYDGAVYCTQHCPVALNHEGVFPIFADSEWDYYPSCDVCHEKHTYVNLTDKGRIAEFNANGFVKDLMRRHQGELPKYAWPGGYPMFYLDADNNVLCPDCATKNNEFDKPIVTFGTNDEDPDLYCDHCGERIESAYSEED